MGNLSATQRTLLFLMTVSVVGCTGDGSADDTVVVPPVPERLAEMDTDLAGHIELRLAAVRQQPGDADRWIQLGLLYEAHEIFEPALECYARAVELDPERPRAWYHLALMQDEAGELESAIATLERVGDLEPSYVPAWWQRGFLLLELGRLDEADAAFGEARRIAPQNVAAQAGRARVALQRGDAEEAARILESLLAGGARQPYLHHLLGGAYRQLRQWERAEIELTKGRESQAIWSDPWGHEAMTHRVEYYMLLNDATGASDGGQPQVAIPIMEELLRKRPEDRRTLSNLSRAYLRVGRHEDGLRMLHRMQELYPDHFEAELNLAAAYEYLGDLQRAMAHVDRSIELNTEYAPTHRRRGAILRRQLRLAEAAAEYEQAVRLAPNDRIAWKFLGDCRFQLGDLPGAEAALLESLRLEPQDQAVRSLLEQIRRAPR